MDKNYFQVDQDTNPRGKQLSQQEITQCLKDFTAWIKPLCSSMKQGLSKDDSNQLKEKLKVAIPSTLLQLLENCNGGIPLRENYVLLSNSEILQAIEDNAIYGQWSNDFLPFALQDEAYLILDMKRQGVVVEWNRDQGVVEEISESLELMLEETRDDALKNKIEFIEDVGLVGKI